MEVTGVRRQAREVALQALFQLEFSPREDFEFSLTTFQGNFKANQDVWGYASRLLRGIHEHESEIDGLIESQSAHWRMDRMATVDRNLLRIAVFEIHFSQGEVPPKVAINEAIEISKKYGNTDSAAFVNGLLDQIARQVTPE